MSAADKNRSVTFSDGRKMPIVGLGTWKSKPDEVRVAVIAAVNAGYRHIDTAFFYGNEGAIGDALKELFEKGTIKREDIFITTKQWGNYGDPSRVKQGMELSLKALQLDYVDLYLMHSPMAIKYVEGNGFPLDENKLIKLEDHVADYVDTWKAMEQLVADGLTKSVGVSNFNVTQLERLLKEANVPCVVNQVENHPLLNQKKLIDFCKSKKIVFTSYSPFASPDRFWASDKDPELLKSPLIKEIADAKGCTNGQLLVAYHLQQGLICIPKSVTPSRIKENFLSLDVVLTDDDIKKLDSLECNFRACPWQWYVKHPHYPF